MWGFIAREFGRWKCPRKQTSTTATRTAAAAAAPSFLEPYRNISKDGTPPAGASSRRESDIIKLQASPTCRTAVLHTPNFMMPLELTQGTNGRWYFMPHISTPCACLSRLSSQSESRRSSRQDWRLFAWMTRRRCGPPAPNGLIRIAFSTDWFVQI